MSLILDTQNLSYMYDIDMEMLSKELNTFIWGFVEKSEMEGAIHLHLITIMKGNRKRDHKGEV